MAIALSYTKNVRNMMYRFFGGKDTTVRDQDNLINELVFGQSMEQIVEK